MKQSDAGADSTPVKPLVLPPHAAPGAKPEGHEANVSVWAELPLVQFHSCTISSPESPTTASRSQDPSIDTFPPQPPRAATTIAITHPRTTRQ